MTGQKEEKSLFGGSSTSRNLLFEYHGTDQPSESLFELILSEPGMSELIHAVWDEFELWRKENVLKMVRKSCCV